MSPEEIKTEPDLSRQSNEEVEDILAETEPSPLPVKDKSLTGEAEAKFIVKQTKIKHKFNFRILTIPLVIVILCGLIYGGYWLISNYRHKSVEIKDKELTSNIETIQPEKSEEKITPLVIDSDGDGLTDKEEKALGTDSNKPDTDNDSLFDKEEVKIYQTNPLNSDTDGDGIPDGTEVKKGDDPNDPTPGARLLKLEEEIKGLL